MAENKYHVPNLERALSILKKLSEKPNRMTQKERIDFCRPCRGWSIDCHETPGLRPD